MWFREGDLMAQLTFRVPISIAVDSSDIARQFGQNAAEQPIFDRMKIDAALGSPGDFGLFEDDGNNSSDDNMFGFIVLRNKLPSERATEMKNYRANSSGDWARPDALVHSSKVREYYEIKPMSFDSWDGGQKKFPKIDRFIARFQLPYRRGDSYLSGDQVHEAELLESNAGFQSEMEALQTMFGLRKIRLFLQWERPEPGLLLYLAKVTAETNDPAPRNFPMQELATCVVKLGVQAAVPAANLNASATRALQGAFDQIRNQLNQLRSNLAREMNLHQTLLNQAKPSTLQTATTILGLANPVTALPTLVNIAINPAMRPVVGAAVQTLNPAKHTMAIWKATQDALSAADAALQARNPSGALTQLAVGLASFVKADQQLTAFREGTELAGRRAQVIIGVTAAAVALTAVAVFSFQAVAVGGVATTSAGTSATALSPQVRIAAEAFKEGMIRVATAESPAAFDAGVEMIIEEAPGKLMQMVVRP